MASVIAPVRSQNMMPTIGEPKTPRQRASRSRSAASAARRAVMSRLVQTIAATVPSSPRSGVACVSIQQRRPRRP